MSRRSKEDAQVTRAQILVSALDVFFEKGYTATTFADIAKRINLTKGAVYWHFPSKLELLAALIIEQDKSYEPMSIPHADDSLARILQDMLNWADNILIDKSHRRFFIFAMTRVEWSQELSQDVIKVLALSPHFTTLSLPVDPFERLKIRFAYLQETGAINQDLSPEELTTLVRGIFFATNRRRFVEGVKLDTLHVIQYGLNLLFNQVGVTTHEH